MVDKDILSKEINKALDMAEKTWKQVESEFLSEQREFSAVALKKPTIDTQIPGHSEIEINKPEVGDFIAFVLDIRNSTEHLIRAISEKKSNVSQLERVLYEITAINTAGEKLIRHYKGGITEFLGDGFLSLFKINEVSNPKELYKAHNAANDYINNALPLINDILYTRYKLPPLQIGIGMAFSKAIITTVGIEANLHAKAIGECVYRASKLSFGINKILIDERLKKLWPSSKEGKLSFYSFNNPKIDFTAFEISK